MKAKIFVLLSFIFISSSYPQNLSWIKIGNGVQYSFSDNKKGNNIFVAIGGWQAKQEWVNSWCSELNKSKLYELGVKHIFSVKGPDDVCNRKGEINIKNLAEYIKNIIYATYYIDKVIIAAHSSGSFVANELLHILYGEKGIAKDSFYVNKVYYFNLDGGIGGGDCGVALNDSVVKYIAKVYAVAAYDSATGMYSSNYETMIKLSGMYKEKSELILLGVTNSDCIDKWCLHDAVVNRKPHNPAKYDLEKDYTLFDAEHTVQTDYLNVLKK
ncbi:MAG: hypothetical protein LDL01_06360 [Ignavibacterium sp.]|uniref:Alpha/beta hydrolase n=1 Tax=Ignavibacterium album TaxID=591197 RepID=A0A7V2ZMP4_9BACT|nr:hypothetical protein [Ignavibacterium sp.]